MKLNKGDDSGVNPTTKKEIWRSLLVSSADSRMASFCISGRMTSRKRPSWQYNWIGCQARYLRPKIDHRIGRRDTVLVQHLVFDGSLDARMAKKIIEKQKVIDSAPDIEPEKPKPAIGQPSAASNRAVANKPVPVNGEKLTEGQVAAIHEALELLDQMCDGAQAIDGMGFNELDTNFGKSLARSARLSPKQAAWGKKIVIKYKRQLLADLIEKIQEKAS